MKKLKLNYAQISRIITLLWKLLGLRTLITSLIYILNALSHISVIAFLIPLIQYIKDEGAIDETKWYWNIIKQILNSLGQDINLLTIILLSLACVTIFQFFQFLKEVLSRQVPVIVAERLRQYISKMIFWATYQNIAKLRKSKLSNLFTTHAILAAEFFSVVFEYLFTLIQAVSLFVLMCMISNELTVIILIYALLQFYIVHLRSNVIKQISHQVTLRSDQLLHLFQQCMDAYKFMLILNINKKMAAVINDKLQDQIKERKKIQRVTVALESIQEWIHILLILSILYISYELLHIDFARIVVFLFVLFRFAPIIRYYASKIARMKTYYPSVAAIFELKNQIFVSQDEHRKQSAAKSQKIVVEQIAYLNLKDISFAYDNKKSVLKKINIKFYFNKIYALMGASGEGKSTLIDIILGLLKPDTGKVTLQGKDEEIRIEGLNPFYLPQSPVVFAGTVKKFFLELESSSNKATDQEIITALKKVNLWEFLRQRQGLETLIEESGSNLSKGQLQRLALAAVFLKPYHLIVLDEFTAAIDEASKEIILAAIKEIKEALIIIVTHDQQTASIAHEVNYLHQGVLSDSKAK